MNAESGAVLDASAVLAWLRNEPGAEVVDTAIDRGVLCTVNASEVAQKLRQHGNDGAWALGELHDLGLALSPFTSEDALAAAAMWPSTRGRGLSLGDRACLATAQRLGRPALTADQAWQDLGLDIEVRLLR